MVAVGYLVGNIWADRWVTERHRGGLGEKAQRVFRKELRGSRGSSNWWEEGILQVCCSKAKNYVERQGGQGQRYPGAEPRVGVSSEGS